MVAPALPGDCASAKGGAPPTDPAEKMDIADIREELRAGLVATISSLDNLTLSSFGRLPDGTFREIIELEPSMGLPARELE